MPVFGRVNVSFKARTRIGEGPVSLPEDFYIVTGGKSPEQYIIIIPNTVLMKFLARQLMLQLLL